MATPLRCVKICFGVCFVTIARENERKARLIRARSYFVFFRHRHPLRHTSMFCLLIARSSLAAFYFLSLSLSLCRSLILHVYSNDVRSLRTQTRSEYSLWAMSLVDEREKQNPLIYRWTLRNERRELCCLACYFAFFFFSLFDMSPMIEHCTVTTAMDVTVRFSNMVLVLLLFSLRLHDA